MNQWKRISMRLCDAHNDHLFALELKSAPPCVACKSIVAPPFLM